jgi:polyhydroxyalkanoate synthesis repressor PhaR
VAQEPIRIKRYPNRRLYASHTSKYVSLPEVETMIREGQTVEIVDSQTGDDLTGQVLVQIIAERHPDKLAMFPTAMLHSMLRANNVMLDFLRDYFRESIAYLDYFQRHGTSSAMQQPMHWMKAWLDRWSGSPANGQDAARPTANSGAATPEASREAIDQRIASLERRIAELEAERSQNQGQ